jgi:CRISPR-associated protein Csx16
MLIEPRSVFITRHSGARDWAARHGHMNTILLHHLDAQALRSLKPGDRVLGTLPVHLAAEVCRRGARYLHLSMDIRPRHAGGILAPKTWKHLARAWKSSLSRGHDGSKPRSAIRGQSRRQDERNEALDTTMVLSSNPGDSHMFGSDSLLAQVLFLACLVAVTLVIAIHPWLQIRHPVADLLDDGPLHRVEIGINRAAGRASSWGRVEPVRRARSDRQYRSSLRCAGRMFRDGVGWSGA